MIITQNNTIKVVTNHLSCDCETGVCGCDSSYALDSKGCVSICSSNRTKLTFQGISYCQCSTGLVFSNGKCVSSCQENEFLTSVGHICGKCHSSCKNCTSSHGDSCIQCKDSYNYYNGYCLQSSTNQTQTEVKENTTESIYNIKLITSKMIFLSITLGFFLF